MYVIQHQRRYKSTLFGPFATHNEATQWLEDARKHYGPHPDMRDVQWQVVQLQPPFTVTSKAA